MRVIISIILMVIAAVVGFFFGAGMNEAMGGAIPLLERFERNDDPERREHPYYLERKSQRTRQGNENMSQIRMFKPSAGLQGIKDFILEVVETAGPNPCPPMVVGVGIGGTFDKCALLAKKALMRPLNTENPDPYYADLEKEMLEKINKLGIGPQGFGGKTTAIGLNIETMPTHIAGMPCAVNINCHVTRHKTEVL